MSQSVDTSLALIEQHRQMMGTTVNLFVAVAPADEVAAQSAITACLFWLEEVATRLTRFNRDSELWHLNDAAGSWFAASPILFDCLAAGLQAAADTDGLFDPTLLRHLEIAGYDQDFAGIAFHEIAVPESTPVPTGLWRGITLDIQQRRIHLPAGAQVDLGGIAKGWAADMALDRFFAPFANVLLDIGGDMRLRGGPLAGGFWSIAVDNPRLPDVANEEHVVIVTLGAGAIATSGATRRWWLRDGHVSHHLIDPRTGHPMPLWTPAFRGDAIAASHMIATATALAPTAVQAEVGAKVALLLGVSQSLQHVESAWQTDPQQGQALILVPGSGDVICSSHLQTYLDQSKRGSQLWIM